MSYIYGTRKDESHDIRDFTYNAETGIMAHGLPEEYKHPDDARLSRKGFEKVMKKYPVPAEVSQEKYDPESELASFLYMNISGQVETSNIVATDLIQIRYTFVAGSEWEAIDGLKTDESQFAKRVPGSKEITWNMNFQIGFRTLSPEGWPKIILELISPTKDPNTKELKGYACVHVPTAPGTSSKRAKVFCPIKDSWWSVTKNKIFGPRCELIEDPQMIADCEGREVTSVFYGGQIKIVFHITQRNFKRFGYKTC